jgi:phosphoribosylformylglycinamidine synthase
MQAKVYVTLKNGILDPQGQAVQKTLARMGFDDASHVRIGKFIEIEVDGSDKEAARKRVEAMCEKLIANMVIEDFRIEIL